MARNPDPLCCFRSGERFTHLQFICTIFSLRRQVFCERIFAEERKPRTLNPGRGWLVSLRHDSNTSAQADTARKDGLEFRRAQDAYRKRLEQIKRKFAAVPMLSRGKVRGVTALDRLELAGVDRNRFLHILAIETDRYQHSMLRNVKRRKESLKKLARRLQSITDEVERMYRSDEIYAGRWVESLKGSYDESTAKDADQTSRERIRGMRACADDLLDKGLLLGDFTKSHTPYVKSLAMKVLLAEVQSRTGDASAHLHNLVAIIQAAFEACGVKGRVPTPGSLEKVLKRHVLPRLRP